MTFCPAKRTMTSIPLCKFQESNSVPLPQFSCDLVPVPCWRQLGSACGRMLSPAHQESIGCHVQTLVFSSSTPTTRGSRFSYYALGLMGSALTSSAIQSSLVRGWEAPPALKNE